MRGMKAPVIQYLSLALAGVSLAFAFMAAGAAAALGLMAVFIAALLAWAGWRLAKRRLLGPRDRTA